MDWGGSRGTESLAISAAISCGCRHATVNHRRDIQCLVLHAETREGRQVEINDEYCRYGLGRERRDLADEVRDFFKAYYQDPLGEWRHGVA